MNSSGQVVWVDCSTGINKHSPFDMVGNVIAVDSMGNCLIGGSFSMDTLMFQGVKIIGDYTNAVRNIFIVKYDSTGNALWGVGEGAGTGSGESIVNDIATDISGNVIISGSFKGTKMVLGSIVLNVFDLEEGFCAKLNPNGTYMWAHSIWGYSSGSTTYESASAVVVDDEGNIYVSGIYMGQKVTMSNVTITLPNDINTDFLTNVFLYKMDTYGNILWGKGFGSVTAEENIHSLKYLQKKNSLLLAGKYKGIFVVDDVSFIHVGVNNTFSNAFLMEVDTSGGAIWGKEVTGSSNEVFKGAVTDESDGIYATGEYDSNVAFFSNIQVSDTTAANYFKDIFICKLKENILSGIQPATSAMYSAFTVFPNPANNVFNIYFENIKYQRFVIYTITGEKVCEGNVNNNLMSISTDVFNNGLYFIQVSDNDGTVSKCKLIINK